MNGSSQADAAYQVALELQIDQDLRTEVGKDLIETRSKL
jgi:hypothetical protein